MANLTTTSLLVPSIRSVSSIACAKLFTRTWTWPEALTPCAPGRPTSETRPRASSAHLPSAVRMRPTVAFVIIRPRASGLSSPLASVIGPSPKNSVRPEPANVSTWVVPSASVPDLKVPAPLTVTTPAMFSSRSETETENVSPSAAPKETVSVRPSTSTLWSTAPPVVFTRKRMRPLICTPPVAIAALPVRKPAMPSVLRTRTPSPSVSVSWDPTLTVASAKATTVVPFWRS